MMFYLGIRQNKCNNILEHFNQRLLKYSLTYKLNTLIITTKCINTGVKRHSEEKASLKKKS